MASVLLLGSAMASGATWMRLQLWLLVCVLSACHGLIGESGGESNNPLVANSAADTAPLRRLSHREYYNTIRDLFGIELELVNEFPEEQELLGFDNNALAQVVTALHADRYNAAAEAIATSATEDLNGLVGCNLTELPAAEQEACVQTFVNEHFGPRAFRRPLTSDEVTRLMAVYAVGKQEEDVKSGVQWLLSAMLQSPRFLYRPEFGQSDGEANGEVPLNGYEVASRLSYFLWQTMPDAALFEAAANDELRTAEQVAEHTRRMLSDDRARPAIANFFMQWFRAAKMNEVTKDPTTFPDFAGLRDAMATESNLFFQHVIWDSTGTLAEILTAQYSFLNQDLAALYGVSGVTGSEFKKTDLDPNQRAGVLTHPGVMSYLASDFQTSPIRRGIFVREHLLCQAPPPPPPDLMIAPPPEEPTLTMRDRFEQHSSDPVCAGCHQYFDSIGFGFENFDAIGKYRTEEPLESGTAPINASGNIVAIDINQDTQGAFANAVELSGLLSQSEMVTTCMVNHLFQFAFGRSENEEDKGTLEAAHSALKANGDAIQELFVALTQTKAFRFRKAMTPGE